MLEKQTIISQQRRDRIINEANFIIRTKCTTRQTAKEFRLSKTTIHRDVTSILPMISEYLATNVNTVLQYNKAIRHLRGGEVTRNRYCKKLQRRTVFY
jgi:putative DeoR family transcriptional regulator (stage III sporulation protein D)